MSASPTLPKGLAPRLIAVDLDGTIVAQSAGIEPAVARAVIGVQERGAIVVAATGRGLSTTAPVAREAGMHEWAIVSNGAVIGRIDPEEVIEARTFDPTDLLRALVPLIPGAMFVVERPDGRFLSTEHFVDGGVSTVIEEVPLAELSTEPVVRVIARSHHHVDDGLGHVAAHLGAQSVSHGVTDVAWLDLGIPGISKATGLASLCERLGIAAAEVLAIGDSMNDIEMLDWAGYSVAMGHASASVRAHADYIAEPIPGLGAAAVLDALCR